jgi:hypothetical protein
MCGRVRIQPELESILSLTHTRTSSVFTNTLNTTNQQTNTSSPRNHLTGITSQPGMMDRSLPSLRLPSSFFFAPTFTLPGPLLPPPPPPLGPHLSSAAGTPRASATMVMMGGRVCSWLVRVVQYVLTLSLQSLYGSLEAHLLNTRHCAACFTARQQTVSQLGQLCVNQVELWSALQRTEFFDILFRQILQVAWHGIPAPDTLISRCRDGSKTHAHVIMIAQLTRQRL